MEQLDLEQALNEGLDAGANVAAVAEDAQVAEDDCTAPEAAQPEQVEKLAHKEDDEALMRFAFRWLAFALSGKQTMKIKPQQPPERKG